MVAKLPPPTSRLVGESPHPDSGSTTRRATAKRADVARVKARILSLMEHGHTTDDACRLAGKSKQIYQYYRRTDPEFRENADLIIARRYGRKAAGEFNDISFEEFSETYLHSRRFRHQMQWVDLIEGREPRDLHPNQVYHRGDKDLIVVNTPPYHAKSTTLTMDYVTYRICTDPNFRVLIISKTEYMAKKFVMGIKRRLTNIKFKELIRDFAPPEGFEKAAEVWSAKQIYFGHGDSDQKDPTVEAVGLGGQIYGARADLIILDDIEDVENGGRWEQHMDFIMQDVFSRDARILVIGTRVAPRDIYTELLNPEHYDGNESLWTYLSQPAVLEFADDPEDWVTLWPRSDQPNPKDPGQADKDGLFRMWDGPRLAKKRRGMRSSTWAMVYMQESVPEDALFTVEAFNGCQSPRPYGELLPLASSYVVAGLDPATNAGYTACTVLQVDRRTGKRYLIAVFNKRLRSQELRQLIFDYTERFGINEWRIEKNAFQAFLTQDREINQFLASRGVRLKEHSTYNNKNDYQWGVASLEGLFKGWRDGENLLDLPTLAHSTAYTTLREQLVIWHPDHPKTQKTDLVMSLWFAELGVRDAIKGLHARQQENYLKSPFHSERDREGQVVINIDDYLAAQENQQRWLG